MGKATSKAKLRGKDSTSERKCQAALALGQGNCRCGTGRYHEGILRQREIADFGEYNVPFEGGLAFYKKGLYQSFLGERTIASRANSFELYFERDGLAELEREIERQGFEFIHRTREEPWRQRVLRFYDADDHIVCLAERMETTTRRLAGEGKSMEEIARVTGLAVERWSA